MTDKFRLISAGAALTAVGLVAITPSHAADLSKANQVFSAPPKESTTTWHGDLLPSTTRQAPAPHEVPPPRETNHGVDNSRMNPTHDADVQRGIDRYFSSHGRN